MLGHIWIGCVLAVATTIVHAGAMGFALRVLRARYSRRAIPSSGIVRAYLVASLVLVMFLASIVESAIWAVSYIRLGAIDGFEPALYFSMVTFTTLGYGDLVLNEEWRLVASFQAAVGIIMFGWTTALIVAFVQRVYLTDPGKEAEAGRRSA